MLVAVLAILGVGALAAPRAASAETWCGTESSTDRPDTTGGNLIHVVYAFPADGPNRFAERASAIATELSNVARWWHLQDPSREPRFDFAAMPGCGTRFGQLDITVARAADPAGAFVSPDGRLPRLVAGQALAADKKYLFFFDSPVALDGNVCGNAYNNPRDGGPFGSGAVWMAPRFFGFPTCGMLGSGGWVAKTAAHEIVHFLGALDSTSATRPPHACPSDPAHPCDSLRDVLFSGGDTSISTTTRSTSGATTTTGIRARGGTHRIRRGSRIRKWASGASASRLSVADRTPRFTAGHRGSPVRRCAPWTSMPTWALSSSPFRATGSSSPAGVAIVPASSVPYRSAGRPRSPRPSRRSATESWSG